MFTMPPATGRSRCRCILIRCIQVTGIPRAWVLGTLSSAMDSNEGSWTLVALVEAIDLPMRLKYRLWTITEIMKALPNIHPGEVLLEEFLAPMDISQNALARAA